MSVDAVWAGISTGSAVVAVYCVYLSAKFALEAMGWDGDEDVAEAGADTGK